MNLLALTLATGVSLAAVAAPTDDAAWIEDQRQKWNIPGVTVALVRLGEPAKLYASGFCDIEAKRACVPESVFHIASITKFFTGLLAAELAEEGLLNVDEPLSKRWPEFRLSDSRWKEVTLRDVLAQRAGLGWVDWPYIWDQTLTRETYIDRLVHVPMATGFREKYSYANANFIVAGSYLERVTGTRWEDLLLTRLVLPLNMRKTGFQMPSKESAGYGVDRAGRDVRMPPTTTQAIGPAGSIVSSAKDFAALIEMVLANGRHQGKQVLHASAVALATSPATRNSGFGIQLGTWRNRAIHEHAGGYPGYSAYFALLPTEKVGVVVLSNRNSTSFPEAMAIGLLERVLGLSQDEAAQQRYAKRNAQKAPRASVASDDQLPADKKYEGQYCNPAWGAFDVMRQQEKYRIRFGTHEFPLEQFKKGELQFAAMPGSDILRLTFIEDAEGKIFGFLLKDVDNPAVQVFEKRRCGSAVAR